jgi:hypothetical protein
MREKECHECRWVSVTDASGRRRLEMRWQLPVGAPAGVPASRAA